MKCMPNQRGFTVAELLVALGISSTVMIGTVAAIGIGGRTFQVATEGIGSTEANDGLARISADIEQAIHFDERTTSAIAFYVPDRTGDGSPEHMRYAWSGTAGDPITLSLNGSDPAAVIEGVDDVSFEYVYVSIDGKQEWASAPVEYLLLDDPYDTHDAYVTLSGDTAVAMIVEPVPPADVRAYAITRVSVPVLDAATIGDDAEVTIRRVNMVRGTPEAEVLAAAVIDHVDLPNTYDMVEVEFDTPPTFNTGDFVAVTVQSDHGGTSAYIPLESSPSLLTDGWAATSSTPGSWSLSGTYNMPLVIYAIEVE